MSGLAATVRVRLMPDADRDLLEIDAEAGMALLPAGLAVVAVVDAQDREVGRIDHRDGGKRADAHQQLAVAGDDQHALVRARQRQAEPHHAGGAHGAAERIDVGAVARNGTDVAGGAAQSGDEQKILVAADQRRHGFAALQYETRGGGRGQADVTLRDDIAFHLKMACCLKTVWRRSAVG